MSKKVLISSPALDGTGYSQASIGYMLALDSVGVDVVCRPVKMTNTHSQPPAKIVEFMKKWPDNVSSVLSHNLPHEFVHKGGVQNVGMFAYETGNYKDLDWNYHFDLMDKLVVFCQEQKNVIEEMWPGKYSEKTYIVPHAVDTNKFDKKYEPLDLNLPNKTFKFYAIGEFNKRKNWQSLILSYFHAFTSEDAVVLIVKTNDGVGLEKMVQSIKQGCNLYKNPNLYPKLLVVSSRLTEDEMCALHAQCDCYVSTSYGESWNFGATDSLGFGNPVIVPSCGAFKDYVTPMDGFLVEAMPVLAYPETNFLYSSRQYWHQVNTYEFAQKMRKVYQDKETHVKLFNSVISDKRKDKVQAKFNYQKVGGQLLEVLDAA